MLGCYCKLNRTALRNINFQIPVLPVLEERNHVSSIYPWCFWNIVQFRLRFYNVVWRLMYSRHDIKMLSPSEVWPKTCWLADRALYFASQTFFVRPSTIKNQRLIFSCLCLIRFVINLIKFIVSLVSACSKEKTLHAKFKAK